MTEKEISELIVNHISENIFKTIGFVLSTTGSLIAATWFACKSWYKREIEHLKSTKASECQILHEQINFLNQKLQDNNSYANGIIEVAKNQLLNDKNELTSLNDLNIVTDYENKLALQKEKYDEDIAKLEKEKESLYKLLSESKTEKSEMMTRLSFVVKYLIKTNTNHLYNTQINQCYTDLVKKQDDDNFYIVYSKFSSIISHYLIFSYDDLRKEKEKLNIKFYSSRVNNLNHTIKIIEPFIFNDSNNAPLKELMNNFKKTLEDLDERKKKNNNDQKE